MNRRKFIKRGAILCPAIVGLKAYPQALTLADPSRQASGPSSASCTLLVQQTTNTEYWDTGTNMAQRIKNASAIEICQIDLLLMWQSNNSVVKVQIWSNADRSGTQYGSDSSTVDVTSASYYPTAQWATFTFATKPNPTGNFWICLVQTSTGASQWRMDYNHTLGASGYPYTDATDDGNFCAYAFGADKSQTDMCFKLYTMQ